MTHRMLFIIYLALIHLVFAGVCGYLLRNERLWLVAIEAFFLLSLLASIYLLKKIYEPIELVRSGAEFIRESDFNVHLRPTGKKELDLIIDVYNQMMNALREERLLLTEKNFLLEKIIAASPSAIVILDFEDRVSLLNPSAERLFGNAVKNVVGKKIEDVGVPIADELSRIQSGESRMVNASGNRRFKAAKSAFIDRGFTRHFFIIEELTEELRRSEKEAYEKVIRLLSHEVNNSGGAVRSLLQSCLNYANQLSKPDRDDYEHALSIAISRTESLTKFMHSYAQLIKLPKPKKEPTDIEQLLRNTATLFYAEAERRNIQIEWNRQATLDRLPLDRAQMEQVFINIIKNAMEAVGENGKIMIHLNQIGLKPCVVIEDTGGGISDVAKQNLFTPFFSTKENGQGLGLTLVQEILTNHGFEFSLATSERQTTEFKMTFNQDIGMNRMA
ncbi:MAG: ATP-binding protein [Chloroherpetonaceae bacterium]